MAASASGDSLWDLSVNATMMSRSDLDAATLVTDSFGFGGTDFLNAAEFDFDSVTGLDASLIRNRLYDDRSSLEVRYFDFGDFSATRGIVGSDDGGVVWFNTPIGNTAYPSDISGFYGSKLNSFEVNLRRQMSRQWTFLVGFRHMNLTEDLIITQDIGPGLNMVTYNVSALNHMDGVQVGAVGDLWRRGRLDVGVSAKLGALLDSVENSVLVTQTGPTFASAAQDDNTALLAELALNARYAISSRLTLRAGYQWMKLQGVALAADQVASSDPFSGFASLDTSGDVSFNGFTAGLECSF